MSALAHYFIPRGSNNQKAKLIHKSSLIILVLFFVFYQLTLSATPKFLPRVLGYAANISVSEVIRLTNAERAKAGLAPLTENPVLAKAAAAKGADMLAHDYWAHVSPTGRQPWWFFKNFGYRYRAAGENLARDFADPGSAVAAWMASKTHRENILSPKYREIGIGVVEGDLAGRETTIIVQFLGTRAGETAAAAPAGSVTKTEVSASPQPGPVSARPSLVSPFEASRTAALLTVGVLMGVVAVDGMLVTRRRVVRIGGRSLAHFSFLGMILAIVLIARAGNIL